jgi:hypothetical protein
MRERERERGCGLTISVFSGIRGDHIGAFALCPPEFQAVMIKALPIWDANK